MRMENEIMDTKTLLLTDWYGIYLPKMFVTNFDHTLWNLDVGDPDVVCVQEGPKDNEWYWESWDSILNKAYLVQDGRIFYLHQDGDLWAVCWDDMAEEDEYLRSFG